MRVAICLRGVAAAAGVVVGLVAIPATAQAATTNVPCDPTGGALKTAISTAGPGGTLVLARRCVYSIATADNDDNALPKIAKKLTIIGNDATIQRDPMAATKFRIFEIDPPAGDLTLTDLTVRNGHAPAQGGGIWLNGGGTLKLTESVVTNNTADSFGGGIDNDAGAVTVNSSILSHNTSADGAGGGMDMDGGTATFDRSIVTDNTSTGTFAQGGGLWLRGTVTLNSTLVTKNTVINGGGTGAGGGIFNYSGTVTLNNTRVTKNTLNGGPGLADGAGIANFRGSSLKIEGGEVDRNSVTGTNAQGGGIYNAGTLTTNRLGIERNTSTGTGAQGGGLTNTNNGTATLTRTEVQRNTASTAPGGINNASGTVTLIRSEVEHNKPTNCAPTVVPGCVG